MEIGTLAPIEVVKSESEIANRKEDLIVAEFTLKQMEDQMKKLITSLGDPAQITSSIEPLDPTLSPSALKDFDLAQAVSYAIEARPEIKQARKSMVEMLLGNHPLDCPVCDAGGECELQDMTFSYGAAESKYIDIKTHRDEQQWSPVVYFDRPRCILCYRCVRVCGEAMDVSALGVQNRGVVSTIVPNKEDHLECEECGMCIDICPVGALTSGAYRYKTRPWEMKHVGTTCTHCADGCKTTLGVRRSDTGMEIVRGDNRDKSGINGDFLCIKGRYAFDFANHEDRLTQPLVRKNG